jgi:hypothetical protein
MIFFKLDTSNKYILVSVYNSLLNNTHFNYHTHFEYINSNYVTNSKKIKYIDLIFKFYPEHNILKINANSEIIYGFVSKQDYLNYLSHITDFYYKLEVENFSQIFNLLISDDKYLKYDFISKEDRLDIAKKIWKKTITSQNEPFCEININDLKIDIISHIKNMENKFKINILGTQN